MKNETSYILLGEGDYTYSLDACRYLTSASSATSSMDDTTNDNRDSENSNVHYHRITCTGIDTLDELQTKYHNVNFVLTKLHSYNSSSSSSSSSNKTKKISLKEGRSNVVVTTNIIHGVNAVGIDEECNNTTTTAASNLHTTSSGYDHVIFNHPHIGTENATLHSQFLSHLFYTSNTYWMKSNIGLLHITLVVGQCERWNCILWATKHELVLLRRGKFIPPPPPPPTAARVPYNSKRSNHKSSSTTYYNLRRHQSGQSFANRRCITGNEGGDSETLVFGRMCDYTHSDDDLTNDDDDGNSCSTSLFLLLPWERDTLFATTTTTTTTDNVNDDSTRIDGQKKYKNNNNTNNNSNNTENDIYSTLFTCKYCNNKSFREYRSLKNHLLSLHPACEEMHSLIDTIETKKKKKKKNQSNDKKRKSSMTSVILDENNDKCQEITKQQHVSNDLHDCNDKVLISPAKYRCSLCDTGRVFSNEDALVSHQRATHFGIHKDIKPDWYRQEGDHDIRNNDKEAGNCIAKSQVNSEMQWCQICDRQFVTGMDDVIHALEFLPSSSAIANAIMMERSKNVNNNNNDISVVIHPTPHVQYECIYCRKSFTQVRAQHQHENFCSSRQQSEQSTNT